MSKTSLHVVSVIVPCRNEGGHIGAFLESVIRQKRGDYDVEVLIADGMSTDGTREIICDYARQHPAIRLIDNPALIVSTGLNRALREARGEVIVRMDVHTVYAADYVRQCVAELLRTGADNVGGCPRVPATNLRNRVFSAAYHSAFAVGGSRSHNPDFEGYVDTVFYGCWRKTTLVRLGGFDEELVRDQDDELNLRLTRAGGKIWQSRRIVCWYTPRTTIRSLFLQHFQYGFWKVLVIRKHKLPASWRHLVPGTFVLGNALLLLVTMAAALAHSPSLAAAAAWTEAGVLSAYAGSSLIAAALGAHKYGWRTMPFLPALFLVYHVAYGCGFLAGVVHWTSRTERRPAPRFLELTR